MENLSINQQLIKIQDRLLSFAYSLTEGRDEAEDLLQETSLRVLDNQEYYKENTNFLSWSFTVMKNIFPISPFVLPDDLRSLPLPRAPLLDTRFRL